MPVSQGSVMSLRGRIKKGKVLLDNPKALPDGTEVEVRPVTKRQPAGKPRKRKTKPRPRSLAQRLAPFIGVVKDLPPDMSVNLDHYLYGHPKVE
jgi:hypothetical protein